MWSQGYLGALIYLPLKYDGFRPKDGYFSSIYIYIHTMCLPRRLLFNTYMWLHIHFSLQTIVQGTYSDKLS